MDEMGCEEIQRRRENSTVPRSVYITANEERTTLLEADNGSKIQGTRYERAPMPFPINSVNARAEDRYITIFVQPKFSDG